MIEVNHPTLSIRRQCQLIGLNRATFYSSLPAGESPLNLTLMNLIDQEYTKAPFYGYRKITHRLKVVYGYEVNRKWVARLMQQMGLHALYPTPRTSMPDQVATKYSYLLHGLYIYRPNLVWSTDITYIPLASGFMYLVAVMDWFSRMVLAWQLSNTLETGFCLVALRQALAQYGQPEIFNSDQGVQFTSEAFTREFSGAGIRISHDGRGHYLDNIFNERLWRIVKYEDIYLKRYETVPALTEGLTAYFDLYNHERPHQSLQYHTPPMVYHSPERLQGS